MSKNSLKVSDTTKTEFFEPIFFQRYWKIWLRSCRSDLSSSSDTLRCLLSISDRTWGLLRLEVTPLFHVYNLRKKSPLRVIIFLKVFKILCRFLTLSLKIQEMYFSLEIIAFEFVALNNFFDWERILFIGFQNVNKQSQNFR